MDFNITRKLATSSKIAIGAIAAGSLLIASAAPSFAAPRHHGHHHRGHHGRGVAPLAGFGLGLAVGNAFAGPRYYGPGPGYVVEDDSSVQYCLDRYKSYDVRSGTYLGYDGYRHPCP